MSSSMGVSGRDDVVLSLRGLSAHTAPARHPPRGPAVETLHDLFRHEKLVSDIQGRTSIVESRREAMDPIHQSCDGPSLRAKEQP